MGTYVTPTGFTRPTLQEIKLDLEGQFRDVFGVDIDTSAAGPFGQIIGIMAKNLSDAWEGLQEIYTAHDPAAATGTALDIVAALSGVDRIEAANAVADLILYTDTPAPGVLVPAGRQARRVRGGVLFSLRDAVTISPAFARDIYLEVPGVSIGQSVTLFTSFGTYTATALGPDPEFSILEQVAALVNADTAWSGLAQAFRPVNAPADAQFTARPCLRLVFATVPFSVTLSAPWVCPLVGVGGVADCAVAGPETADAGEIREIATPVAGWTRVFNLLAASPGRNLETDDELRIRRAATFRLGNATDEAIKQALLNRVAGIISATVTSNRTLLVDSEGRPPKSFEAVVQGGENQEIGDVIWDTQPSGIESFGNTLVVVQDSEGVDQNVRFTRPEFTYLWIRIIYSLYNEEVFPLDGEAQIASAIVAWAVNEYTMGKDVIPDRVKVPVYSVPGIGPVTVEVSVTPSPAGPPVFGTAVIPIGGRVVALTDTTRILFHRIS